MKGRVFNACVRSCLLYGSETWPMTNENERRLKMADSRMLRKMCGKRLCERNTIEDIRKLIGLEEITDTIRKRRLRWLGHVIRKDRLGQEDMEAVGYGGNSPCGCPRKTWESTVLEDLPLMMHSIGQDGRP